MIKRQIAVDYETLVRTSITPNIDYPDDSNGGHERLELVSELAGGRFALTQRERATQRFASLGEMTGGIVHDFRNILAIIEAGLRLVEKHSEEPEKASLLIAGVHEGIDRGLKLTSQLLTFAKQRKFEARAGNTNELLKQLEVLLRYGAGSGIHVAFELAPEIPNCLLDPSQFNAAMVNLVLNARDAMPAGGEVQISTALWEVKTTAAQGLPAPGTYIRVRVKDGGQGMPPRILQRIFDPFFTTKGEQGSGLGLPQVCAFMRLLGGYGSVASERGKGTTFDLLFPPVVLL